MKLVCCKTGGKLVNNKLNKYRCCMFFLLNPFQPSSYTPANCVFFLFCFFFGGEEGGGVMVIPGNGYTVFTSIRPPNPDSLVSLKYLEKANDGIMSSKPKVGGGGGGEGHIAFGVDPDGVCVAHCLHSVS